MDIYYTFLADDDFEMDGEYPTQVAAKLAAVEYYNNFMDNLNDPSEWSLSPYYILKYNLTDDGDATLLDKVEFKPELQSKRELVCYPC